MGKIHDKKVVYVRCGVGMVNHTFLLSPMHQNLALVIMSFSMDTMYKLPNMYTIHKIFFGESSKKVEPSECFIP